MCDFNNLTTEEKLHYHEIIITCANNYGGINFFLQLVEKVRDVSPHPLSSRHQDFLFDLGNIRWDKTIFQDKIDLIAQRRKSINNTENFLPSKEDKSYKRTLNLIKTLSPVTFSVRPALRADGEGFDFKAFDKIDEEVTRLNPIFEVLFFCSIETVKKILNYK